jgi:hypothetical protein
VAGVTDAELVALGRLRGRFAAVTIVQFMRSSFDNSVAISSSETVPTAGLIRVTAERPFADAWNGALHRGGRMVAFR